MNKNNSKDIMTILLIYHHPGNCVIEFQQISHTNKIFLVLICNPFLDTDIFLHSLKAPKKLWFSIVFRGYRKRPAVWNGLTLSCMKADAAVQRWLYRSNHQGRSIKDGILTNFAEFTGKHLHQSLFLNKVTGLQLY